MAEEQNSPRVWLREQGLVVRDVSPDLYPFVLRHMKENFLRDEPLNQAMGTSRDELAVEEMCQVWETKFLPQNVSLVALQENTPGADLDTVDETNPAVVIGVNLLIVCNKNDPPLPDPKDMFQSDILPPIISTFFQCGALVNAFERYGVESYLEGVGLSVLPSWRGKGVGQLIVKARDALCKERGIPLTKTVFSAIQSQKAALKNGFELLAELNYDDLRTPEGQLLFPQMHPDQKKVQLMAKRIF